MTGATRAHAPQTTASLANDLRGLGVRAGDTLLLHSSLRALGWVCGGATAVVRAFLDVIGAEGTLVVPAQTTENRDPSRWTDPPPAQWWPTIRAHLPGFDPALSPVTGMGVIAERVRTWPGAHRSEHPQTSFAGVGRQAATLLAGHRFESHLGEDSPLARLEAAGARVLLLGVGFDRCTAFHLAEYRLPDRVPRRSTCVVATPTGREWITIDGIALDSSDFSDLGSDFVDKTGAVTSGPVGAATAFLFPFRDAVGFAEGWFLARRHRVPVRSS